MGGINFYPRILPQAPISSNVNTSIDPTSTGNSVPTGADTPESSENILTCLWDACSSSWFQVPIKVPLCARYLDNELTQRIENSVEAVKDVAKLTAGFAFMFFLLYMIKRPERDAYHTIQTFVLIPENMLALTPTLQEAAKENPLIQVVLANAASNYSFRDDDVLIEAGTFGPEQGRLYVPRQMYNQIAKTYQFKEAL